MTLRTHLSRDYSEASASRRQRACYHSSLSRLLHDGRIVWSEFWECLHCGATFEVKPVTQKEKES